MTYFVFTVAKEGGEVKLVTYSLDPKQIKKKLFFFFCVAVLPNKSGLLFNNLWWPDVSLFSG